MILLAYYYFLQTPKLQSNAYCSKCMHYLGARLLFYDHCSTGCQCFFGRYINMQSIYYLRLLCTYNMWWILLQTPCFRGWYSYKSPRNSTTNSLVFFLFHLLVQNNQHASTLCKLRLGNFNFLLASTEILDTFSTCDA